MDSVELFCLIVKVGFNLGDFLPAHLPLKGHYCSVLLSKKSDWEILCKNVFLPFNQQGVQVS